jgi:lactate dehydrogenase-like 2-hydroxyacid dehydrogenase
MDMHWQGKPRDDSFQSKEGRKEEVDVITHLLHTRHWSDKLRGFGQRRQKIGHADAVHPCIGMGAIEKEIASKGKNLGMPTPYHQTFLRSKAERRLGTKLGCATELGSVCSLLFGGIEPVPRSVWLGIG